MEPCCRVLDSDIEVGYFVDGILKIRKTIEKREAINSIAAAERNIRGYEYVPTLTHRDNRDFEYRDDQVRVKLRESILEELENQKRLENDDNIVLGLGGAAPLSDIKAEKRAFYIIGPPAAGKSGIASKVADLFGAYILDSDYAKRKLPEYTNQIGSASLVHDESSALIFDLADGNLLGFCVERNYNIVIPKIGHKINSVCDFCRTLTKVGYEVYLISVELDREKATQRAYYRYKDTQRYVPLALIFDGYSNQPTLNYFKIKQQYRDIFSGFAQISTDVPKGTSPIILEEENIHDLYKLFGGDEIV